MSQLVVFLSKWNVISCWLLFTLMEITNTYLSQTQIKMQIIYDTNWLVDYPQQQLRIFFLSILVCFSQGWKYLVRYQDYASDTLVLRLGSNQTTKTLCALNSSGVGNCSVVVVSLIMMIMRLFDVNSINTSWKVRAIMAYM